MRALRNIEIDGQKLRPIRNHPILEEGEPDYDNVGEHDGFDRQHFHYMLRDYLDADPAIRFQMAKNYFERALFTAEVNLFHSLTNKHYSLIIEKCDLQS